MDSKMPDDIQFGSDEWEFLFAERCYYRGGNILKNKLSKPEKILSGQDALDIFNAYGLPPRYLKLMAMSHGFQIDKKEFIRLLEEQKDRFKNMKPRKHG